MLDLSYEMNDFEASIAKFIMQATGDTAIVKARHTLAGGGSRDTWLLDAVISGHPETLVMRRDLETEIFEHTLTREEEFILLQVAREHDVTVPQPRWLCMDQNILGKPFFLMDYVDGVSIGVKIVHGPLFQPLHQFLPGLLGLELAKIHQIPLDDPRLAFLPQSSIERTPAQQALYAARETLERLHAGNPAIEFGMRWLEQNAPISDTLTLIHGDYRIGNFIVGERGLHAIIDWEFSHIGDPHEDLAWGCVRDWRFGKGHLHFGGISNRDSFVEAYMATGGVKIDLEKLDYWEILGNMRWAITCLSQADRHLSGQDPSVEFASLGRRSAEMQLEFLQLIEAKGL